MGFWTYVLDWVIPISNLFWLATDTSRSVSVLAHVHVRYGVYLSLLLTRVICYAFWVKIAFIFFKFRIDPYLPSCVFIWNLP